MTLNVCLLASEAAPLSKTGGLADVSSALTKYLHAAGHDVRLFTPLYSSINRDKFPMRPVEGMQNMDIAVGTHQVVFRHPQFGERRQSVVVTVQGPNRIAVDFTKSN